MLPLAISLGDLGGIGPEVTLKALRRTPTRRPIILYGDAGAVHQAAEQTGFNLNRRPITLRSMSALRPKDYHPGRPSRRAAESTLRHLTAAIDAVRDGEAAALVTAPIQKEKLTAVGFAHPGHTEYLAARTGARAHAMMLAGPRLRVVLATIHVPLAAVAKRLTPEGVFEKIALTHTALRQWYGVERPKIAVLGLNPHAGESGLFGHEETRLIRPAVRKARRKGWLVDGPHPADGYFGAFGEGAVQPDAVVCMYHDQGLIPLKLLHFHDAINVTLGLPIIRTSPDHGTAYDIAGRNLANATSMREAIRWADRFAARAGR